MTGPKIPPVEDSYTLQKNNWCHLESYHMCVCDFQVAWRVLSVSTWLSGSKPVFPFSWNVTFPYHESKDDLFIKWYIYSLIFYNTPRPCHCEVFRKSLCPAVMMMSALAGIPLLCQVNKRRETLLTYLLIFKESLVLRGDFPIPLKVIRISENFHSNSLAIFMCESDRYVWPWVQ